MVQCSICLGELDELANHYPVVTACGHFFGKSCVEVWIKQSRCCPACRKPAKLKDLRRLFGTEVLRAASPSSDDRIETLKRQLEEERQKNEQLTKKLRYSLSQPSQTKPEEIKRHIARDETGVFFCKGRQLFRANQDGQTVVVWESDWVSSCISLSAREGLVAGSSPMGVFALIAETGAVSTFAESGHIFTHVEVADRNCLYAVDQKMHILIYDQNLNLQRTQNPEFHVSQILYVPSLADCVLIKGSPLSFSEGALPVRETRWFNCAALGRVENSNDKIVTANRNGTPELCLFSCRDDENQLLFRFTGHDNSFVHFRPTAIQLSNGTVVIACIDESHRQICIWRTDKRELHRPLFINTPDLKRENPVAARFLCESPLRIFVCSKNWFTIVTVPDKA